jgi:hypothetical protein
MGPTGTVNGASRLQLIDIIDASDDFLQNVVPRFVPFLL